MDKINEENAAEKQPMPFPEALDILQDLALAYVTSSFNSELDTFIEPGAFAMDIDGDIHIIAMYGGIELQRRYLKALLPTINAIAVVVVNEQWMAATKDPAEFEKFQAMALEGKLQEVAQEEVIQIMAEGPDNPAVTLKIATITNVNGQRNLAEFQDPTARIIYPYPGFRRYFPDVPANREEFH